MPFPPGSDDEAMFGVGWRCPACQKSLLNVSATGPIEPGPNACLNCGVDQEDGRCPSCGVRNDEERAGLELDEVGEDFLGAAKAAFEQGLLRRGLAILNDRLVRDPSVAEAWAEKARVYASIGLGRAVLRAYARAISLRREPAWIIALACALHEQRRFDEANGLYEALLSAGEAGGFQAIALANQANALVALGRSDEARARLEKAIELEPLQPTHRYNLARALLVERRWAEVVAAARAGLEVDPVPPYDVALLLMIATAENEQHRGEGGLLAADQALVRAPDHPRALYLRAWSLGMLGRLDEARASLEKLLVLEPDNANARAAVAAIDEERLKGRSGSP